MNYSKVVLTHTAIFDPALQKMQMDKQAGGRPAHPAHPSPQISDKRDDRDRHGGPKGSAESSVHRDLQARDKQENSLLKEEMKRERMLITVSREPLAMSKPAVDQVKDKTVVVESKGCKKDQDDDDDNDDVEEKSSNKLGKTSEAKSSKSEKKVLGKKKIHKAKKKKSKKKKDKRKS